MFTLTLVFNKERDKVLMCIHKKQGMLNYIGGKVEAFEEPMDASYRELEEEIGISRDKVKLHFLRQECVSNFNGDCWNMFVTYGVLHEDVELVPTENPLAWMDVNSEGIIYNSYGYGNCYTFLRLAKLAMEREVHSETE